MASNNGRDQVWTPDIWKDIDDAVVEEVARLRVARQVFTPLSNGNDQYVPKDVFHPESMTIEEGQTKPYLEISLEFELTQTQLDHEATLRTGRTLARLAAKSIALAEDLLFFQGKNSFPKTLADVVKVANGQSAENGLLGIDNIAFNKVELHDPRDASKAGVYGENTFKAVGQAISQLTKQAQPGPYALNLESDVYADTWAPFRSTLTTTADRLMPRLQKFLGTGTLPPHKGLLVSLGGEPTSLYVGQDAITAYVQQNAGMHCFRVFERVQIVARDPRAFVRLDFDEFQQQ